MGAPGGNPWGDPAAKNHWFAGVEEGEPPIMDVDFRVGGTERVVSVPEPGGPTFTYEAEFRDIVADRRIVMTNQIHRDAQRISINLVSVEFTAEDERTRVTITDHGAYLDGLDRPEWREAGTVQQLDRLTEELKQYA